MSYPTSEYGRGRRQWLVAAGASLVLPRLFAAGVPTLSPSASLTDELRNALRKGNPLVVMVSLEGCIFCKGVRESHLVPMREQSGLDVVQVDMRTKQVSHDFRGASATHEQLIQSWGVRVAPTVLFFGPGGVEVAERLTGGYIPDFYGAYLDERLAKARIRIKA
ncbi:thioredoxin-related protein [Polaromonas sp. CG_9.5]|uniref:thioredoxin fold domain-containing protein n=1 Tax=Polaromonas sp. CG_9.5 TaxID=3071705 RepID=UPI002E059DA9|nr:thioredoxin-related protein [Polaromonas sp. CG_9.5]